MESARGGLGFRVYEVAAIGFGVVLGTDPVGGSLSGVTALAALCTNLTEAQSVFVPIPPDDTTWDWNRLDMEMEDTEGKKVDTMAGTWNGSAIQLAKLIDDVSLGRAHFPRRAYARFMPDRLVASDRSAGRI